MGRVDPSDRSTLSPVDLHLARLRLHRHFAARGGAFDDVGAVRALLGQGAGRGAVVFDHLVALEEIRTLSSSDGEESCRYLGGGAGVPYATVSTHVELTDVREPGGRLPGGRRPEGLRASVGLGGGAAGPGDTVPTDGLKEAWKAVAPAVRNAKRARAAEAARAAKAGRAAHAAEAVVAMPPWWAVERLRTALGRLVLPPSDGLRALLDDGRFVRIALTVPSKFRHYPWELAGHPYDHHAMIVDDERFSLTRHVVGPTGAAPAPESLLPEVVELVRLSPGTELDWLAARLPEAIAAGAGVGVTSWEPEEFRQRALLAPRGPAVLHLLRHGEEGESAEEPLVAAVLARDPALVVLSQCFSGDHEADLESVGARLCRAGVPLVVAASGETLDDAQLAFAQRFHARLAEHGSPELAVQSARLAVGHDVTQRLQIMLFRR